MKPVFTHSKFALYDRTILVETDDGIIGTYRPDILRIDPVHPIVVRKQHFLIGYQSILYYDYDREYFLSTDRSFEGPIDGKYKQYAAMIKAMLHSDTPFVATNNRIMLYARSQIWCFPESGEAYSGPVIPDCVADLFDPTKKITVAMMAQCYIAYVENESLAVIVDCRSFMKNELTLDDIALSVYVFSVPQHYQIVHAEVRLNVRIIIRNTHTNKFYHYTVIANNSDDYRLGEMLILPDFDGKIALIRRTWSVLEYPGIKVIYTPTLSPRSNDVATLHKVQ